MIAVSVRPVLSPPAERGMHFRRNPAAIIASYAGFVAANRSSGVGRDSASIAGESTSFANLRDRNCSSRWLAVSRKSMAIHLPSSRTYSARQPTSLRLQQADHSYFGDGLKYHVFAPGVAIGGDARGRATFVITTCRHELPHQDESLRHLRTERILRTVPSPRLPQFRPSD